MPSSFRGQLKLMNRRPCAMCQVLCGDFDSFLLCDDHFGDFAQWLDNVIDWTAECSIKMPWNCLCSNKEKHRRPYISAPILDVSFAPITHPFLHESGSLAKRECATGMNGWWMMIKWITYCPDECRMTKLNGEYLHFSFRRKIKFEFQKNSIISNKNLRSVVRGVFECVFSEDDRITSKSMGMHKHCERPKSMAEGIRKMNSLPCRGNYDSVRRISLSNTCFQRIILLGWPVWLLILLLWSFGAIRLAPSNDRKPVDNQFGIRQTVQLEVFTDAAMDARTMLSVLSFISKSVFGLFEEFLSGWNRIRLPFAHHMCLLNVDIRLDIITLLMFDLTSDEKS